MPDDVCSIDSIKLHNIFEVHKANQILLSHRGKVLEEQKALEIFESAAKRGSAEGLYNLASMHLDGKAGLARDPRKWFDLCCKAADQKPYMAVLDDVLPNTGVAEAENAIGVAYRDGLSVDQDDKKSFNWFLKSAQHGCPMGMHNVGSALANGTGCKQNLTSARWWYQNPQTLDFQRLS